METTAARWPQRALALRPLEAAAGIVFGQDDTAPATLPSSAGLTPRQALEDQVLGALARGPCVVSFSGGRDSSAVLALATQLARREGLAPPIPATLKFTGVASTEESSWQELVVRHLGLRDWELIPIAEELDLLGPVAQSTLRSHGLLWPTNAYLHVPILERASGGSLLTGLDGDGLLGNWRWARAQAVLHRRVRPIARDVLRVTLALAPARIRRPAMRPALLTAVPWMRPAARRELAAAVRIDAAAEPRRFDRRLAHYARQRYHRLAVHSFTALGAAHAVAVIHPLLAPPFLAALVESTGPAGYPDRTSAMRSLFGDLLPEALLTRRTKGEFGRAIWRTEARRFASGWDGRGLDAGRVDPELLRSAWRLENPWFGSATLLQAAWLAASAPSPEK